MCKLGVISQEQLKIEVTLLLSANRKSYMPRRLAQQQVTLSDLEWPFDTSHAISAVAELLILISSTISLDVATFKTETPLQVIVIVFLWFSNFAI